MFGPAFLVAPVHVHHARSREVWLPQGADWYDFNSGARHTGGQAITAEAPLARMPCSCGPGRSCPRARRSSTRPRRWTALSP
ncbi:hypothetical protein [Brevundimonas denitrificans]|uniref:hypothetical protein n=1 Tax=Brevundimonas denitrificans TaxID=1443434 RepID=UPI00352C8009